MAFHRGPKIVTDGLVLYLDAANPKSYVSGSTQWNDLSLNRTSGSLLNGPTFNTGSNGSIVFDGVNDYVQVPSPYGDIDWSTQAWSISAWMKLDTLGDKSLVNLNSANSSHYVVNNIFYNDKKAYFYFIRNSPAQQTNFTQTTGVYNTNEIFYFTVTYTGTGLSSSNLKFYRNSTQLITSTGGSAAISNQTGLQIGGTNYKLDGNIYNFSLYGRVLSPEEILQNYNSTKSRFNL